MKNLVSRIAAKIKLKHTSITEAALAHAGFSIDDNEYWMGDLVIYKVEDSWHYYVAKGVTHQVKNMQQVSDLVFGKSLYYGR